LWLINVNDEITRDTLLIARDYKRYKYFKGIKDLAKQIREIFETTIRIENITLNLLLVVDGLKENIL